MHNHAQNTHVHSTGSVIRVLVADDHPIVRHAITQQLSQQPDIEVRGQAGTAQDALSQIQSLAFDVVMLDINMPGRRTIDVVREIVTLPHCPRVMILTGHNDPEYIMAMLKAGAKGYVLKDESPENISVAVRAVARGEVWLSGPVLMQVVNHQVSEPEEPVMPLLSARESQVLAQLIQGKDNQEIADHLGISERTVRFHLRNIYDKLGVRGRGEAMAWGIREHFSQHGSRSSALIA
jgi:DNA-binding NarL/FixJ family response regulator